MPNAAVRANARALPEATDDAVFVALRSEIDRLNVTRGPIAAIADALHTGSMKILHDEGVEVTCAWEQRVGLDSRLDEIDEIDTCTGRIVERMLELGPKTPASIAAVAETLKREVLGHHWDEPEGDRDWDVLLLTRFLDGLISLLPGTAKEDQRLPEVA